MRNQTVPSKLNALKTGAYALGVRFPWESEAAYEKMRAEVSNDYQPQGVLEKSTITRIVDSLWQRERLRSMTAIAICRHSFGRTLEKAGAKSWSEVLAMVHAAKKEHYETLEKITAFTDQIAATAGHLKQTSDACD